MAGNRLCLCMWLLCVVMAYFLSGTWSRSHHGNHRQHQNRHNREYTMASVEDEVEEEQHSTADDTIVYSDQSQAHWATANTHRQDRDHNNVRVSAIHETSHDGNPASYIHGQQYASSVQLQQHDRDASQPNEDQHGILNDNSVVHSSNHVSDTVSTQQTQPQDTCTQCPMRQLKKESRLLAIKQQILSKLRLDHVPNITRPLIEPPKKIIDRFEKTSDKVARESYGVGTDEYHFTPTGFLLYPQVPQASDVPYNYAEEEHYFYFNFSDISPTTTVKESHVYVHVVQSPTNRTQANLTTRDVTFDEHGNKIYKNVQSRVIRLPTKRGKWYNVRAKSTVQRWIGRPQKTGLLEIIAVDEDNNHLTAGRDERLSQRSSTSYLPFFTMQVEEETASRAKRNTVLKCTPHDKEERCCLYDLVVNFEEWNWAWVLLPRRYKANYCTGECPFIYNQESPHTHMVQQMSSSGNASIAPCCNPRKMAPISMLYYDESLNIKYGTLPDMVALECGCS